MNPTTTSDVPLFPWTTMISVPADQIDRSGECPTIKSIVQQANRGFICAEEHQNRRQAQVKTQKVFAKTL